MTPLLVRRRAGALLPLSLALLASSAVACGGVGGGDLFGSGGAASSTTSSGGGAATTGTGTSSGTTGTTGTTSGTASTSSGMTSTSSGMTSTSSGTTSTSSTGTSSGMTSTSSTSSGSMGCAAGYVCVDDDPAGWSGHYYVTETMLPAPPPPGCPPNLSATTSHEDPAGPAQCTACACGPIQGASCAPPTLTCWAGSTNCGGNGNGTDWTPALADGMCHTPSNLLNGQSQLSCKITAPAMVTSQGSCEPSGGMMTNPGSWQTRVDACGTDQSAGSCGAGKVCVPQGSGDPNESLCVLMLGVNSCPAGWTKQIVSYSHVTDTRACTDCACGDGASCGDSHYTFYDTATCTSASAGGSINVGSNASMQCTDVSSEISQPMWSAKGTLPQVHGQCPASGGQPTGSVTPSGPFTYCCQ